MKRPQKLTFSVRRAKKEKKLAEKKSRAKTNGKRDDLDHSSSDVILDANPS